MNKSHLVCSNCGCIELQTSNSLCYFCELVKPCPFCDRISPFNVDNERIATRTNLIQCPTCHTQIDETKTLKPILKEWSNSVLKRCPHCEEHVNMQKYEKVSTSLKVSSIHTPKSRSITSSHISSIQQLNNPSSAFRTMSSVCFDGPNKAKTKKKGVQQRRSIVSAVVIVVVLIFTQAELRADEVSCVAASVASLQNLSRNLSAIAQTNWGLVPDSSGVNCVEKNQEYTMRLEMARGVNKISIVDREAFFNYLITANPEIPASLPWMLKVGIEVLIGDRINAHQHREPSMLSLLFSHENASTKPIKNLFRVDLTNELRLNSVMELSLLELYLDRLRQDTLILMVVKAPAGKRTGEWRKDLLSSDMKQNEIMDHHLGSPFWWAIYGLLRVDCGGEDEVNKMVGAIRAKFGVDVAQNDFMRERVARTDALIAVLKQTGSCRTLATLITPLFAKSIGLSVLHTGEPVWNLPRQYRLVASNGQVKKVFATLDLVRKSNVGYSVGCVIKLKLNRPIPVEQTEAVYYDDAPLSTPGGSLGKVRYSMKVNPDPPGEVTYFVKGGQLAAPLRVRSKGGVVISDMSSFISEAIRKRGRGERLTHAVTAVFEPTKNLLPGWLCFIVEPLLYHLLEALGWGAMARGVVFAEIPGFMLIVTRNADRTFDGTPAEFASWVLWPAYLLGLGDQKPANMIGSSVIDFTMLPLDVINAATAENLTTSGELLAAVLKLQRNSGAQEDDDQRTSREHAFLAKLSLEEINGAFELVLPRIVKLVAGLLSAPIEDEAHIAFTDAVSSSSSSCSFSSCSPSFSETLLDKGFFPTPQAIDAPTTSSVAVMPMAENVNTHVLADCPTLSAASAKLTSAPTPRQLNDGWEALRKTIQDVFMAHRRFWFDSKEGDLPRAVVCGYTLGDEVGELTVSDLNSFLNTYEKGIIQRSEKLQSLMDVYLQPQEERKRKN